MNDLDYALKQSQQGLPLTYPHLSFLTIHLKKEHLGVAMLDKLQALYSTLEETRQTLKAKASAVCSVDTELWVQWCKKANLSVPMGLDHSETESMDTVLNTSPPFCRTGGHLFFHLKAEAPEHLNHFSTLILNNLSSEIEKKVLVRGNAQREGTIYGRRILHGIISSVDPINFSKRAVIGNEDPSHRGGCFALTQRFVHDWDILGNMTELHIENMIGRDHKGNLVPGHLKRSHLKCVRILDEEGLNYRIVNQGQVYGNSPTGLQREEGAFVTAYAKSVKAFTKTLQGMLGDRPGFIRDEHLTVSTSDMGNFWYVPSAKELALPDTHDEPDVSINDFFKVRSKNGYQYYNTKDFLHNFGRQAASGNEPLSPRIMGLLGNTFSRWHNNWYTHTEYPDPGHLKDHPDAPENWADLSIAVRKGMSIGFMLDALTGGDKKMTDQAEVFRIDADEVLVGVLPPFTLGTGVRVMAYLTPDEHMEGFFRSLDEFSMAGHITPHYETLLKKGLGILTEEAEEGAKVHGDNPEKRDFYTSVALGLKGVQTWFRHFARLAGDKKEALKSSQTREIANLKGIKERMERLSSAPPASFLEAAQLVFGMHCCLHSVGELVSLGRFDQYMAPFLEDGATSLEEAQEIIDAFWIKMDERVLLNRQFFDDWRTFGTCAVPYIGTAAVPQGDKASQWVMQLTIGGWQAHGGKTPTDGCNEVTRLCLKAIRRLPVNSPCVSLRMNPDTPADIVDEAAQAILSGGSHPFLMSDVHLVPMLEKSGDSMDPADARDYCADGCWEPIIQGKTEFGLSYCPVMNALEATLNRGATYIQAGSTYLRGANISFPSPPAEEIESFDAFMDLFYAHYRWQAAQTMNGFVNNYGSLGTICPSPLLSALVVGCMDSGRDLTQSGARHHILSPMIFGLPCAIDSLWAILKMVYDPSSAVTNLGELRDALICDWGHDMIEPFQNKYAGPERSDIAAQRFKQLRETALALPSFGNADKEVDRFGGKVAATLSGIFMEILETPAESVSPAFAQRLEAVYQRHSLTDKPFSFTLIPAFGTFEDYYGLGLSTGASADGRRKGATLSSNFSPMPSPSDKAPDPRPRNIFAALKGWNGPTSDHALNIPGPVDIDIPENTEKETVREVIRQFAEGNLGSNILTINCCDRDAMTQALEYPERYDLIRLRMGGWAEFFITMFPAHQQQHLRRPMFVDNTTKS